MPFPKPQETIVRETKRIAIGTVCLDVVMMLVYVLLKKWTLGVLLGALLGSAYAVLNFFLLGLTVQEAASLKTPELAQMKMRSSYSMRMVGMVLVVIVAFAVPFLDGLACLIPTLFPRLTILALQMTGKIKDE